MTHVETKRARGKCTANALVCQLCWIFLYNKWRRSSVNFGGTRHFCPNICMTRKLCYRKDDRAIRRIYWYPGNFRDSLTTPTATFPKILWDFIPIAPSERALVSCYRPSIHIIHLSTLGLHRIWLFQIRPEPDLAETCFGVREQYVRDKTNGVNNAVSCYRGSTVQCFLCCVTVCQSLIKFVEWQWIWYFSSILPEYQYCETCCVVA